MNDPSFASLNPALLARKGGAKPAMRPQLAPLNNAGPNVAANLEDLGWNDMGEESEPQKEEGQHQQVLHLTPEPSNETAAAEARALDQQSQAALKDKQRPEVRRQQEALVASIAQDAPAASETEEVVEETVVTSMVQRKERPTKRRSALERGKRAAFTLRLDEERHLKLRLLSTVKGRSAQQIVTEALDAMLNGMDEIESLAAQVKRR